MADQSETNDCGSDEVENWSNKMCIKISNEDTFPVCVKDTTIQKGIINRFLNFYLSGKTQKGLTACDIIFAVISIIPFSLDSEELIWHDDNYSEEGGLFCLTPEDRLKKEIQNIFLKQHKSFDDNLETAAKSTDEQNDVSEILEDMSNNKKLSDKEEESSSSNACEQNDDTRMSEKENDNTNENIDTGDQAKSLSNTLVWFTKKVVTQKPIDTVEYGPAENAAFCISCNKLLDRWDSDEHARIYLKYFFGFAALTLMRTISKSYQNVIKVFSSSFSKIVAFSRDKISYSIPDSTCVKKSFKSLRKLERKTKIVFAKLVLNSFYLDHSLVKLRNEDRFLNTGGIVNIFKTTVLTHTAYYGLGIIAMLQAVASRSDFEMAFQSMFSKETEVSWQRVNQFLKTYMSKSSHELTFHWARIIDSRQFNYLTCEENYELAVVIAVFIEKLTHNIGIWNANWVKTGRDLEIYKKLGFEMYKNYTNKCGESLRLQISFLEQI